MLVVETPLVVSAAQQRAALVGAGLSPEQVRRVEYAAPRRDARGAAPGCRADRRARTARARARPSRRRALAATRDRHRTCRASRSRRPVAPCCSVRNAICSCCTRPARCGNSRRWRRSGVSRSVSGSRGSRSRRRRGARRAGGVGGDDLVFAAQAIVPRERPERMRVARLLVAAAEADPSRRVVVKLRAEAGEKQTHREHDDYRDLLARLARHAAAPARTSSSRRRPWRAHSTPPRGS